MAVSAVDWCRKAVYFDSMAPNDLTHSSEDIVSNARAVLYSRALIIAVFSQEASFGADPGNGRNWEAKQYADIWQYKRNIKSIGL
jgi:hypothetical protein